MSSVLRLLTQHYPARINLATNQDGQIGHAHVPIATRRQRSAPMRVAFSYAVAAYVLYLVVALSSPWLLPRGLRLDDDDAAGATGAVPLAQQPTGAGAAGIRGSSATLGSPFLNWTLAASSSLRAGGDAAPPVDPVTWFAAATALHGAAAGRASRAEGDTLASAEAKQLAAVCASPLLLEAELEGGWRGLVAVDPNGCFSRLDKAGAVDVGRWVSHTPLRPRETFGSLAARGQQQQRRRLRQAGAGGRGGEGEPVQRAGLWSSGKGKQYASKSQLGCRSHARGAQAGPDGRDRCCLFACVLARVQACR